ncbi:asparagine synthase (glutamine-hydrolyzing) [Ramlibacter alkalitolerans]|uniref:asparagine synthase (glutamine-hydrolyzing) n=1 Tax=Ramlibacter alkalitolerans TaxID=2039631 RepID=A0ABS1JNH0_9BURK|nr:asparagine synthase (glutamine-hydrolyzing) [Ramlibacter alkalitolerans]MBL0425784.1 asparagine synthase (glutamine-hydrolyzing) [Ramlibacter alkalitolerans]
MCGITGFLSVSPSVGPAEGLLRLQAMTRAIAHRGPDADGHEVLGGAGSALTGLGHRRLSIIDLSPAGAQPMKSHDGRFVIAFNGEIYNFADLRVGIEQRRGSIRWRGHSDTEVLLELFADLGVQRALELLDGMFALAVHDRAERTLTLARDPFGEKPLYYGCANGVLLFGSELKSLRAWPGFAPSENADALADFLKYSYVPAPATIYEGVWKLPPATSLTVREENVRSGTLPAPVAYWDMVGTALAARQRGFAGTRESALEQLQEVLGRSARRRMVSDVPLGALLSGGIDSSLTTALMQDGASQPVRTFTIGMEEAGYDEAVHARAVSKHLGTRHTELRLTSAEVQAAIPEVAATYDEPFADSSQVPTYLVSRMAREHVTVVLSGDGGDELFAGYNRYFHGPRVWSRLSGVPSPLRHAASATLRTVSPAALNRAVSLAGRLAPRELAAGKAGEKIHKLAGLLSAHNCADFHNRLLTTGAPLRVLAHPHAGSALTARSDTRSAALEFAGQAMLLDTANYLPDDVLTKVDRASMAVALEVRTPFLSREVFKLAWRLPLPMKVDGLQGKTILRELLYRHVPRALVDRPKAGFAVPVGRWLRAGLRDWAESLLDAQALQDAGVFDVAHVRRLWADHLSGRRDHETQLWSILMYQGWRRSQRGAPA